MSQKRPPPVASPAAPGAGATGGGGAGGGNGGAVAKRARKEKDGGKKKRKSKKGSKPKRRSMFRLFKIDAQLYKALADKQKDLDDAVTSSGAGEGHQSFQFGSVGVGQLTLTEAFLDESSGSEISGLCAEYIMDKVPNRRLAPTNGGGKGSAASASSSSSSSSSAAAAAAAAVDPDSSCCIPLKVFTKDSNDQRVLVDDVGDEFHIKVPPRARKMRLMANKKPARAQGINIVSTIMKHVERDKIVKTTVSVRKEAGAVEGLMTDEQIQGAIYECFRQKPAWTAKDLALAVRVTSAAVKRHLKQIDADYHQGGSLAAKYTIDPQFKEQPQRQKSGGY